MLFAATSSQNVNFSPTEPISKVILDIREDKIEKIEIDGDKINVDVKEGDSYTSRKEEGQSFYQAWVTILTTFLPLAIIILFFFFIFRQARGGASSFFSFGQSRARQFTSEDRK